MRNICDTSNIKLCFEIGKPVLFVYKNVDMASDVYFRKSTFSFLITFVRETMAWQSKLQKYVTLSIIEKSLLPLVRHLKSYFKRRNSVLLNRGMFSFL